MPGGDRTGPGGMGPMTGRGAGYCAGYGVPGYMNPGPRGGYGMGMGMGWGRGGGRGRERLPISGWRVYAAGWPAGVGYAYPPAWGAAPAYGQYSPQMNTEQETEFLRNQAKVLSDQLEALNKRLAELEEEA